MKSENDIRRYADIIDLPHHQSESHAHMPVRDRAAQFSPFAALTGFDSAVRETARSTEGKIELHDDEKSLIDGKLRLLLDCGADAEIEVTYFVPDSRKKGGKYTSVRGKLLRINKHSRELVLSGGESIPLDDISEIKSNMIF